MAIEGAPVIAAAATAPAPAHLIFQRTAARPIRHTNPPPRSQQAYPAPPRHVQCTTFLKELGHTLSYSFSRQLPKFGQTPTFKNAINS